jgi:hypothetical protein
MRQTITGTFHGNDAGAQRGDIVEVGDEAERYIRVGLAEPLGEERAVPDEDTPVETAVPAKRGPGRPKKAPQA